MTIVLPRCAAMYGAIERNAWVSFVSSRKAYWADGKHQGWRPTVSITTLYASDVPVQHQ